MKKKLSYLASVFIIIFIVLGAFHYYKQGNRNLVETITAKKDLVNILIAGRKSYHNNTFKFFAILTINSVNKNVGITFIPPQYKIKMDDDEFKQISKVEFSDFEKIRSTIKTDLKLDIPFFVKIYSEDVVKFVDLIEGIDLFSLDQASCVSNIKFGLNYMDGNKIFQYINCAEDNSIFIKYDRILDLLQTLYHDREKLKSITNIKLMYKIIDSVKTNLLPQEIFTLINLIKDKGELSSTLLPGGYVNDYYEIDDLSYKSYQQEFLTKIVVKHEGDPNAKIRILNGTDVSGLARKLRNSLMRDGLNVVEFSTSPFKKLSRSIIISRSCDHKSAELVSETTGISDIYYVTDNRLLNNILIIMGGDSAK